jgi:hypothetical protein
MRKLIFGILLGSALIVSVFGQEGDAPARPVSRVLDTMTEPNCERLQASMDFAGVEMQNNPAETLYAVIHPGRAMNAANGDAALIGAWVKNRRFDPTRVVIGFGTKREKREVELIAVPPGAEEPKTESFWVRKPHFSNAAPVRAPMLIVTETEDENPCFYDNSALADLGEYLKANSAARARIVIKIFGVRDFNEQAREIRGTLSETYGVGAGRIQITHVRSARWPKAPPIEIEYWLLPAAPGK